MSELVDLLELLAEALRRMEEQNNEREGDYFDLDCGNCDGAVPMPHSFGCRVRNALLKARGGK